MQRKQTTRGRVEMCWGDRNPLDYGWQIPTLSYVFFIFFLSIADLTPLPGHIPALLVYLITCHPQKWLLAWTWHWSCSEILLTTPTVCYSWPGYPRACTSPHTSTGCRCHAWHGAAEVPFWCSVHICRSCLSFAMLVHCTWPCRYNYVDGFGPKP